MTVPLTDEELGELREWHESDLRAFNDGDEVVRCAENVLRLLDEHKALRKKNSELTSRCELYEKQIEGWKEAEDETEIQEKVYNEDIRILTRRLAEVTTELESMKQWDAEHDLRKMRLEREEKKED